MDIWSVIMIKATILALIFPLGLGIGVSLGCYLAVREIKREAQKHNALRDGMKGGESI